MDRLILLRHGKAEAESASGEDFDRPLAPRGVAQAREMGERLAALGWAPDLVLVSSAQRTRDTWEAASEALGEPDVQVEPQLYNATSASIREIAEQAGERAAAVMVIGHNPGLHELTFRLMAEGATSSELMTRARRDFPTGAMALFAFENGEVRAEGLYFPEKA